MQVKLTKSVCCAIHTSSFIKSVVSDDDDDDDVAGKKIYHCCSISIISYIITNK